MGGSGGNTCMPDAAVIQIDEGIEVYDEWEADKAKLDHITNILEAKCMSMQLAGMILPYTDAKWFGDSLRGTDTAGMPRRALMRP